MTSKTKAELVEDLDAIGIAHPGVDDVTAAELEKLLADALEENANESEKIESVGETAQEPSKDECSPIPENPPAEPEPPASGDEMARRMHVQTPGSIQLNVRDAPDGDPISLLSFGEEVDVLDEADGWCRIAGGWVMAEFLA